MRTWLLRTGIVAVAALALVAVVWAGKARDGGGAASGKLPVTATFYPGGRG